MWKVIPNPKIDGMASIWIEREKDEVCLVPFIPIKYAEQIVAAIEARDVLEKL